MNMKLYKYIDEKRNQFFKLPKWLKHSKISNDAKLLYAYILDRYNLSMSNSDSGNGWTDDDGNVFCYYSRKNMMKDLNVSKSKITKVVKELVNNKLLIEVRQGLTKPNRLYILKPSNETMLNFFDFKEIISENQCESIENTLKAKINTSRSTNLNSLDTPKSFTNNTYSNKTNFNNKSIYQSQENGKIKTIEERNDKIDRTMKSLEYFEYDEHNETVWKQKREQVLSYKPSNLDTEQHYKYIYNKLKWQLDYSCMSEQHTQFQEIFNLILEIYLIDPEQTVMVNQKKMKAFYVQKRFEELNSSHIDYVIDSLKQVNDRIFRINEYILTALYNSVSTKKTYYYNKIRNDHYESHSI